MRLASADHSGLLRLVYETARSHGPGAALAAQHGAVGEDTLVVGPGGHAVVPAALVSRAVTVVTPVGRSVPMTAATPFVSAALERVGVAALRCAGTGVGAGPTPDPRPEGMYGYEPSCAAYRQWAHALTWLRLGLCDRLRDGVLTHLSGRTFGGTPLLQQQLVKGALADAAIERLEVRGMLGGAVMDGLGPGLALPHERITGIERLLLRLCGAHGFALQGLGPLAYTSELLGDVYLGQRVAEAASA